MKKVVVIYILIICCLFYLGNKEKKDYEKSLKKFDNYLDNISYNDKKKTLEEEYDKIIENINNLSEEEVTKNNISLISNNFNKEYLELNKKNEELGNKKTALVEQKNVLTNQYNKLLEEERKKHSYLINGVSKINQYSIGYPTGCESAALTLLLNYWGKNVSVKDVVNILPKGSKPYYENGTKYGGNPYLEFIGTPSDYYSYGVYDIPIENVANNFKNGIINGRGMSLKEVLELVRQDRPVIVWSSMNMGIPHYTNSWIYKPTGETIRWLADLHAIIVIGYTDTQVITSDTLTGTYRYFNKTTFESRYNSFGKRALYY